MQCRRRPAIQGLIPGVGRSLGEGNGNPLQYSCLRSPMDRGAWWATVYEVTRVGHDLLTKPPPPQPNVYKWKKFPKKKLYFLN